MTLDLATVKQIKGMAPGATINDAVLTMIGGSMQRYLQSKDELPEKSPLRILTWGPIVEIF
ncbi:acyltransferase [Pseudomonas sp. GR 6-02]|nr:acyltransferase [Pseudomonas sp. GR 6-02]